MDGSTERTSQSYRIYKSIRYLLAERGDSISNYNEEEMEDVRGLLWKYPGLYDFFMQSAAELGEVHAARDEFQRDRSIKLEERAVAAVRRLGWMDTKTAVYRRGLNLLNDYWMITTEGEDWSVGLVAPCGLHSSFAPRKGFVAVPDAPLDGSVAINRLAEWYGATSATMRKWLKDASTAANKELSQVDGPYAQYLRKILSAKLPESGDR